MRQTKVVLLSDNSENELQHKINSSIIEMESTDVWEVSDIKFNTTLSDGGVIYNKVCIIYKEVYE